MRVPNGFDRLALLALLASSHISFAIADGAYDGSWIPGGRELIPIVPGQIDDRLRDMAVQPDGKLLLAGDCDRQSGDGSYYLCIARLRPDGSLDLSFGPSATGRFTFDDFTDYPPFTTLGSHGLLVQSDGRILLAGSELFDYGALGNRPDGTLSRLTASGNLDLIGSNPDQVVRFSDNPADPGNWIEAVAQAPDGKIIVAGSGNRAGTNPANRDFGVARFNADLSRDNAFGTDGARLIAFDQGGNNDDYAEALALQPDGKIVVAGYATVTTSGHTSRDFAIARLNPDGSFDSTFGNAGRVWYGYFDPTLDQHAYAVKIDRQGRIVVAGSHQWNSLDYDFLVMRLLPNGDLDTAGFLGTGVQFISFEGLVGRPTSRDIAYDIALQSDGKIVLSGTANRGDTTSSFAVARLNDFGEDDTTFGTGSLRVGTFAPGSGTDDFATAMALGPGGLYVAGRGASGSGSGLVDFGIARLKLDLIFADGFQ
jgi:uncharacterized delta-60 repeat protein